MSEKNHKNGLGKKINTPHFYETVEVSLPDGTTCSLQDYLNGVDSPPVWMEEFSVSLIGKDVVFSDGGFMGLEEFFRCEGIKINNPLYKTVEVTLPNGNTCSLQDYLDGDDFPLVWIEKFSVSLIGKTVIFSDGGFLSLDEFL